MLKTMAILIAGVFLLFPCSFIFAETGSHEHHHGHHAPVVITTVDIETRPAELKAGQQAEIIFSIKDSDGKPLEGLAVSHERILHVIIISADFSVFAHIHPEDSGAITPEMMKKAEFGVKYIFPRAGQYLMAVDYAVKDGMLSEHFTLDVAGGPKMGSFKKDFAKKKKFGEYEVRLSIEPDEIKAGREVVLSYVLSKEGKKVKDLEPYLSAPMHVAVVSDDLNNFMHVHGEAPGFSNAGGFGPAIDARIIFPAKGAYQVFSEIKHQGKVIPFSFMVEAE